VPFKELPGSDEPFLRPVVDVAIAGQALRFGCLVDSGALHNRFAGWIASAVGVDVSEGERSRIAVGGVVIDALTVPLELELGGARWFAPVAFCEPWPFGFQLLGQEGFLRFFRVLLAAGEHWLEVELDRGGADKRRT
jgi:hypothetical protein